jgi:hypothetical protein
MEGALAPDSGLAKAALATANTVHFLASHGQDAEAEMVARTMLAAQMQTDASADRGGAKLAPSMSLQDILPSAEQHGAAHNAQAPSMPADAANPRNEWDERHRWVHSTPPIPELVVVKPPSKSEEPEQTEREHRDNLDDKRDDAIRKMHDLAPETIDGTDYSAAEGAAAVFLRKDEPAWAPPTIRSDEENAHLRHSAIDPWDDPAPPDDLAAQRFQSAGTHSFLRHTFVSDKGSVTMFTDAGQVAPEVFSDAGLLITEAGQVAPEEFSDAGLWMTEEFVANPHVDPDGSAQHRRNVHFAANGRNVGRAVQNAADDVDLDEDFTDVDAEEGQPLRDDAFQSSTAGLGVPKPAPDFGVPKAGVQIFLTLDKEYHELVNVHVNGVLALPEFKQEVVTAMARELKKSPSDIWITSIRAGSWPLAGSTIVALFIEESGLDKAAALDAQIRSGPLSKQVGKYSVKVVEVVTIKPASASALRDPSPMLASQAQVPPAPLGSDCEALLRAEDIAAPKSSVYDDRPEGLNGRPLPEGHRVGPNCLAVHRRFEGTVAFAQPQRANAILANSADVQGRIAIVARDPADVPQSSRTSFDAKVRNCAVSGAVAVLIVNVSDEIPPVEVKCRVIPCALITKSYAARLKDGDYVLVSPHDSTIPFSGGSRLTRPLGAGR